MGTNHHLTIRELEILSLISQGMKNNEIAQQLFISSRTVNVHKSHICKKLGLKSTSELSHFAYSNENELNNMKKLIEVF